MEVPRICRSSVAFKASSAKWFLKYSWADFIVGSGGGFCLYSRRSPTSNELTSSSLQQMITSLKSRKKNTYAHSMIQCICHVCIPLQTEHSRCRNGATFLHWKKGLLSKLVSATIKTLHMCNRETTYWIKHLLQCVRGALTVKTDSNILSHDGICTWLSLHQFSEILNSFLGTLVGHIVFTHKAKDPPTLAVRYCSSPQ